LVHPVDAPAPAVAYRRAQRIEEARMSRMEERVGTLVIGAGQAGLSVGYHLRRRGGSFAIVDDHDRIGDNWRAQWDSLRLFTPRRQSSLDGWAMPDGSGPFPSKDEMGDYLEAYARRFELPVVTGVRVDRLAREGDRFLATAGERSWLADSVVVTTGANRLPRVPPFAADLDPKVVQLHSSAYRNPASLPEGPVLVVGAGNSGADIALEIARSRPTLLAGEHPGHVPFRIEGPFARAVLIRIVRFVGHRVLTVRSPIGRRVRPRFVAKGSPLVRVKPKDLVAAGVERLPRVAGVEGGMPVVEGGRRIEVATVIWCTGFRRDLSWIELPGVGASEEPGHRRGLSTGVPGLAFVGLPFQYAATSDLVNGVGRDARYVVEHLPGPRLAGSLEPVA
jgi:putative flavoprotein involved in K+ transport